MKKATNLSVLTFLIAILSVSLSHAQITIDGVSNEPEYKTLATANSNDGFGSTNNIDNLKYYADGNHIYIGIPADLDNSNNVALFFNFSGYGGTPAGDVVGESGTQGIFQTTNFDGSKLDFEVDYAFAMNEGGSTTNFHIDAVRYGSTGTIFQWDYLGTASDQNGTSTALPTSATSFFGASALDVAYENSGSSDEGIELKIKISEFPGVDSTQTVQVFAAIIAADGFWSNELLPNPGYTGGNLGADADIGGLTGDYFTATQSLQHSQEITGDAGWRLLSLPKTAGTIADISDDTPVQGVTGGDNTGSATNFIIYDSDATFEQPTNVSTAWGDGLGFGVYFYNNTTAGSSALPVTLDASGSVPSSDVMVTLNPAASGYTLVGNPYASNFNTNSMTATSSNISNNIAFWNDGTSSYSTQDRTTPYIISPWQGFWVQTVSAAATTLTLPTSGKTSSSTTGTFFSKSNTNRGDIRFTLSSETSFDEAIRLSFRDNATLEYDLDDAGKLTPLLTAYATMAFKSNELLKSVESLPWDLTEEVTIPMEETLVGISGGFTFDWNGLESIPSDWELTFHDYEAGLNVNMREMGEYKFDAASSANEKVNPLNILTGPAAIPLRAKSEGTRFGITITPTTSVNTEGEDRVDGFALDQNYPNPFNPTTTINYSVENSGAVTLSVYNLMGQKVAELVNETKASGSYNVTWNASQAASGMYYYRLEAGGQVLTRKMTLIK